jgi:hypothetical protein
MNNPVNKDKIRITRFLKQHALQKAFDSGNISHIAQDFSSSRTRVLQ